MAIFRTGGVVGAVSGKLGGSVFARAGGSAVVRSRPQRTKIQQAGDYGERKALARCNAVWAASSAEVRSSWAAYARATTFPNRLGEARNITGRALFLKWAMSVAEGNPSVDTGPPISGQLWAPQFFQVYYLEGGPVAVTAWGSPLGNASLKEQLFFQRGRGVTRTRGFGRLRRVYADSRALATEDRYTELAEAGFDLVDGERWASGFTWYFADGFMGARAECYGTVGDVPWTVDDFERPLLDYYEESAPGFSLQTAVVHDGYWALLGHIDAGPVSGKRIVSDSGLPLYPVRGQRVEWWFRCPANTRYGEVFLLYGDILNNYSVRWSDTDNVLVYKTVAGVGTLLATVAGSVLGADVWGRVVVEFGATGSNRVSAYNAAGGLLGSATFADSTFDAGGVAFVVSNFAATAVDCYFDSLAVTGASGV